MDYGELIGKQLGGRYKLLRLVGEGGMGAVYEADDPRMGVKVAVKVVFFMGVAKGTIAARFESEKRNHAKLRDIRVIVTIHDSGVEEGLNLGFLVMDYLDGESLEDWLHEKIDDPERPGQKMCGPRRTLTKEDYKLLMEWSSDVADALCCAHARGVVHRDIKPSNIFLHKTASGRVEVKLIDFGIARQNDGTGEAVERHTATGIMNGTVHYMASEQMYASTNITGRADQYALAAIIFEALTGRLPRIEDEEDPSPARVVGAMMEAFRDNRGPRMDLLPPFVGKELRDGLLKALAEKPEDRFKSIWELNAVICAALGRQPPPIPRGDPLFDPDAETKVLDLTSMNPTKQMGRNLDTMTGSARNIAPRPPIKLSTLVMSVGAAIMIAVGIVVVALGQLQNSPRHATRVDAATRPTPVVLPPVVPTPRSTPTAVLRPPQPSTPPAPPVAIVVARPTVPAPAPPHHRERPRRNSRRPRLTSDEAALVEQCSASRVPRVSVPGGGRYACPDQASALRAALLAAHQ